MRTLERINKVQRAWNLFDTALEVADFLLDGQIRRSISATIQGYDNRKRLERLKVPSERLR